MVKATLKRLARAVGYEIVNLKRPTTSGAFPPDFDAEFIATYAAVRPFTLTTPERVFALVRAVEYVARHQIPGAIVECGVWKGGSMMAVARTLLQMGRDDVDLYLCDTFSLEAEASQQDGEEAKEYWKEFHRTAPQILRYSLKDVKANMASTSYPTERIHYVVGKVEDTLPTGVLGPVSLLRLDTDFYDSTKHELVTMFPKLSRGGVLIVDDYGSFQGCRKAVDGYLSETKTPLLLNRVDSDARIGVKL